MSETDSTTTADSGKLSEKKQTKFELCGSGPSYVGGGIRRSLHGIIYQLNLLMLFMKRALEEGYNFSLATEVDAADKFDDVVFEYTDSEGNTKYRFLQAKHKQNKDKKVNKIDLLNQTREDYSVQKYFISYLNIKNSKRKLFQGEYQDFIICTNIDIDDDIIDDFDEIDCPDPLLEFNKEKCDSPPKRLKFKKGTNLYKELEEILLKNADYYLIAEKLGTIMAKIRNDCNKIITIEKLFTDYKDWIMQHIFDTNTEKMNGNKHYFKLRDDFLNPTDQDKINLNEIFLNAYSKAATENEELKSDNIKSVLAQAQFQLARSFLKSKPKTKVTSHQQEEIQTFLDKLVLAVNQPTEDEIKDIAQEEIGNYMRLIDSELVASKLQTCILDWAKRRHGRYITTKDCRDFFRDVENQLMSFWQTGFTLMRKSKIDKLGCLFENNETIQLINNFLSGKEDGQLLLLYYDNPLLTEVKLMQLKQNARSDEFIFCDMKEFLEQVDNTVCPLKAFQSRASDQLFIMLSDNSEVNSKVKLLLERLFSILVSERKQVILIIPLVLSDAFESMSKDLIRDIKYIKVFDVHNNFGDLSSESQKKLLTEAKVSFQGCKISLGELDDEGLRRSIRGDILSQVVFRELQIKVDNKDDQYDDVAEYYVDRFIHRSISISLKVMTQDHFQVKYGDDVNDIEANQEIILVSDCQKDYESLCQRVQVNIHWLKNKNGQLIWQESRGSISKLQKYVIRNKKEIATPEIDEDYHPIVGKVDWSDSGLISSDMSKRYFPPIFGEIETNIIFDESILVNNVMDVKDKVVIIAAEPGMGKSTMLSHVALQSRNQIGCAHDFCIIKINLRDYYDDFDAWSEKSFTHDEVIKFLFKVSNCKNFYSQLAKAKKIIFAILNDGQLEIRFEKDTYEDIMCVLITKLFAFLYNKRKIVILLDGFDEIAPKYKTKGLCFLETLKETRVHQIWLTTRMCGIEADLENRLNTFSYRMVPFGIRDQKSFLINYWERKLKIQIDERRFEFIFNKLVRPTFQNLNTCGNQDQPSFMGIPLHVMMIATVYEEILNSLSDYIEGLKQINIEKLTAYDLYERFFNIKFHLLYKEINFKDPKYGDEYEEKLKNIITRHEKFALIELFANDDIPEELVPEVEEEIEDLLKLVSSIKEKTGLVTRVEDGRPRFVHRTFADFFAANLLAEALLLKNTRRKRKYHAASDFLYRLLTGPTCIKSIMTFLNYKIASKSEHAAIFNAAIGLDFKALEPIINYLSLKDCLGRTSVHMLFCSGKLTFTNVNQILSQEEIDSLYEVDDLFQWTPWHYIIACHDCSSVDLHFWKNVTHNRKLALKDKNGVTPYILAAKHGCSANCIKAFLQELSADFDAIDNDGMTAMHHALNRNDRNGTSFTCMLIEIGADISVPDHKGITPFDIIMSRKISFIHEVLIQNLYKRNNFGFIKILCEKLSSDKDFCVVVLSQTLELTQIVLQNVAIDVNVQDTEGKTALHHAFRRIHLDGTDTIPYLIKNNANIYIPDNEGKLPSYFNYNAVMKIFSKGHSPKIFSFLNEMVGENIEVMKPFILSMNINNDIAVHILSRYKVIAKILLEDRISVDQTDSEGKTALHYAVMFKRPKNVAFLLMNAANPVARDKNNKTPIEYISKDTENDDNSHEGLDKSALIIYYLLKYGAYFDVDTEIYECSELMKSAQNLVDAVKRGNVEEVEIILRNSKDPQLVVNLKSKDNGRRPIHYAALEGHEVITKKILLYGAIYNAPDNETHTPDTLTSNPNIRSYLDSIELLFLSIQNRDPKNVMKYIEDGVTVNSGYMQVLDNVFYPLHMAIQIENVHLVDILLKHGAKVNMRTGDDLNALHIAASTKSPHNDDIMKLLLESLTLEELYEAFISKTIRDDTPLLHMVLTENFQCLKVFLDKCTFYEHMDKFDGKKILEIIRIAKIYVRKTDLKEIIEEIIQEFFVKCDAVWNPMNKLLEKLSDINFENFINE